MTVAPGTRVRVADAQGKDLGLGTYLGEIDISDIKDRWDEGDDKENGSTDEIEVIEDPGEEALLRLCNELDEVSLVSRTPKIVLDSGNVIYGFECWWVPEGDLPKQ